MISVIVPAFCPADFVDLHASIAANGDVGVEWIVIDDGSGIDYSELFLGLIAKGVRVITLPENRGQAAARNVGLAAARGQWVKFLDADDRLEPGHLAALLEASDAFKQPAVIAFASTCHVYPSGRKVANLSWHNLSSNSAAQLARLVSAPFLSHCGPLFPRELLMQLGGYDESLCTDEDGDLLIRILQAGAKFSAVPGVFYYYQHHDSVGRVSRDDSLGKMVARRRVCEKVIEAARSDGLAPPLRLALAQRMDKIAMSYWRGFPHEAQALLNEARALSPAYRPIGSLPVRMARLLWGPRGGLFVEDVLHGIREKFAEKLQ